MAERKFSYLDMARADGRGGPRVLSVLGGDALRPPVPVIPCRTRSTAASPGLGPGTAASSNSAGRKRKGRYAAAF